MLRSASLKARSIAEAGVRGGARCSFGKPRVLVRFSSTEEGHLSGHDGINRNYRVPAIPQPLPAVAYDYDWDDSDGESNDTVSLNTSKPQDGVTHQDVKPNSWENVTPQVDPRIVSLVAGRTPPSSGNKPYPPPSSVDRNGKPIQLQRKAGGGGGGGGGRHRCPKCGTYTIFSHTEFDNSLYCATCSGWFTAAETLKGDDNMMKVRTWTVDRLFCLELLYSDTGALSLLF